MAFASVFEPSKESPRHAKFAISLDFLVKNTIPLRAIFAFGGLIQYCLMYFFTPAYALVPVLAVVLYTFMDVAARFFSGSPNQYMQRVLFGRVSAQIPNPVTGDFDSTPASSGLVVLHVGARCNHPLGPLAPGFKEFSEHFKAMNEDLKARAAEFGLYSVTNWLGDEASTNNAMMNVYYFRDMDGVSRFAHDAFHRSAWSWYYKSAHKHIGVFHEVFDVPSKSWETIYANMQPTLLGNGSVACNDKATGKTVWLSPLVVADVPALRGMLRRMGRKAPLAGNSGVEDGKI